MDIEKNFLNKSNIFAVVGVSKNKDKYGYKVFFDLLKKGYKVYPVHPQEGLVNGYLRYKDLISLPEKPDVVSVVVPPQVALEITKECYNLGIKKIWFQPGSESNEALNFCKNHNIKTLSGVCIMKS